MGLTLLKGSFPSKADPLLSSQERTVGGLSHEAGNLWEGEDYNFRIY